MYDKCNTPSFYLLLIVLLSLLGERYSFLLVRSPLEAEFQGNTHLTFGKLVLLKREGENLKIITAK